MSFGKNLSRPQFHRFMTACARAHHWARENDRLGHEVRLIVPRYVNSFIKSKR